MGKAIQLYQEALDCLGKISVNYIVKHQGFEGLMEAMQEYWYEEAMESEIQTKSQFTLGRLGTYKRIQKKDKSKSIRSKEDGRVSEKVSKV